MDERVTTDLQEREQQIIETRERTKVWLGGITAFIFLALLLSYIVIMRDYGRKERGRRKLEASNRKNAELLEMRNKIILTISHDIRGPLNNIIGYTELAMDTREKKKRNLQLKKVLGRSKHILHLVNNLLDVYRLNQAKETMHPVPFRISNLLNRVVDGATQPINDKGLLFEHEFVGADAVVKGGRYDHLLEKFGKESPSIGFALVIDELMSALTDPNVANAMFERGDNQISTRKIMAVSLVVIAVLAILGVVTDPTTAGVSDSKQALTYEAPKED